MNATINQMFYPDRRAFFERLALNLSLQPAIKIGPAALPNGQRKRDLLNLRKTVPTETLSTAQRRMKARQRPETD